MPSEKGSGARARTRTVNLGIKSPLLCQFELRGRPPDRRTASGQGLILLPPLLLALMWAAVGSPTAAAIGGHRLGEPCSVRVAGPGWRTGAVHGRHQPDYRPRSPPRRATFGWRSRQGASLLRAAASRSDRSHTGAVADGHSRSGIAEGTHQRASSRSTDGRSIAAGAGAPRATRTTTSRPSRDRLE